MTTRAAYTSLAVQAARTALTIADLRVWWRHELDNRMDHGILPGTPEYDRVVAACAERKAELAREIENLNKRKRAI